MNEAKMDSGKTAAIVHITSRDNALFKTLRKLAHEPAAYRKQGKLWLEGDHLCRAALQRGIQPEAAVFSQSLWAQSSQMLSGTLGRSQAILKHVWLIRL